jgi:hypothetical protein
MRQDETSDSQSAASEGRTAKSESLREKAAAFSTRARWASVGTYSAVTSRSDSFKQGTRARYTGSVIFVALFSEANVRRVVWRNVEIL